MVRIMIVDDQEMIRLGLRGILAAQPGIDVVAEASDGLQALELLQTHEVDVVLMDLRMPGIDGVEATSRIRERFSAEQLRILVFTTFDNDENVFAALQAGANGFLSKGASPTELVAGIQDVATGGGALSATASAALIGHVAQGKHRVAGPERSAQLELLTARERDVVIAIARGLDNQQIAAEMFISPYTVKTHANRAMNKLDARDRAQLVTFAYQAGLMDQ